MTYKTQKTVIYSLAAVVCGVACGLILGLAKHIGVTLSVFYGIFAAGVGALVARFVLHLVHKDTDDRWKATMVWGVIACGLWLWLILNTSAAIQTVLVFAITAAVLNYVGFRFIAKPDDVKAVVEETRVETRKEKIDRLAREMRYKLLEDGKTPNLDEPLCRIDGSDLTPQEAFDAGHGAEYAEAIEYIKTLV